MTIEYDRLRLLWPDHRGLARGKYLYEKGYEPPPVETMDCIENASTDKAFGGAFVDGFVTVKREEWDRYQKSTTDWEMAEYLPFH